MCVKPLSRMLTTGAPPQEIPPIRRHSELSALQVTLPAVAAPVLMLMELKFLHPFINLNQENQMKPLLLHRISELLLLVAASISATGFDFQTFIMLTCVRAPTC